MELDLDEDGYLSRLEDWCKLAAITLGKTADIELTSQHWIVINHVRDFYKETGISPTMRPIMRLLRSKKETALASSIKLMQLFPGNTAKTITRISGLPKPTNCL